MSKAIILVGPNGSGKSTLGTVLSMAFDKAYFHSGTAPKNRQDMEDCCATQMEHIRHGHIVDRVTPICHVVYNPNLSAEEKVFLKTQRQLMVSKSIVIYCTANGEPQDKPYYPKGHYDDLVANLESIRTRYANLMNDIPHTKWDYRTDYTDELIERLRGKV